MGAINIPKRYLLIPGVLMLFGFLFYLIYVDIKKRTVAEFNKEQLILAKTAAQGITAFGTIMATSPQNPSVIGKSILYQTHVQQMVNTHQPIISDVFMAAQGYQAIAMHVPVLQGDTFSGSLAILISIDKLGKQHLGMMATRGLGHAWLLTEQGVEIYCPLPDHTGKLFLDNVQGHPTAKGLLDSIGSATQGFLNIRHHFDTTTVSDWHVTFYRATLGNTYWTILISYPEKVVYLSVASLRNRILLLFSLLLVILGYTFYTIIKANNVLKEEDKRKTIENALRESDRLKSAFINNISHEIRTPLNGIIGFGEILVNETVPENEKRAYYAILRNSTDRLIRTVTDYMDISLIVSGTLKSTSCRFSPAQVMNALYDQFRLPCQDKGLQLFLDLPSGGGEATLYTDQELLRKALDHLLRNAMKYTQRGEIRFGFRLKDECMEFFVRDTGCGIPANQTDEIFKPFRQGDADLTGQHEGSGLGLSIVKGIVTWLGGQVWVEQNLQDVGEEANSGAVFRFTIPIEKKEVGNT